MSASLSGRQMTKRLQGQALKQSGSKNPLDRVSAPKRLAEGGYGEACAMGSCFEGFSTKRGLDLAESSPNGPKGTWEWLKAVSPKNAENNETRRGLCPKTRREGGMARPSPLPKRSPRETAGEGEEEARTVGGSSTPGRRKGRTTSTRLLITLRHHRRLGDAPTYKTHQGSGERAKKREERGRRRRGKELTDSGGVFSREWRGKGSSRGLKECECLMDARWGPPRERGRPLWPHG